MVVACLWRSYLYVRAYYIILLKQLVCDLCLLNILNIGFDSNADMVQKRSETSQFYPDDYVDADDDPNFPPAFTSPSADSELEDRGVLLGKLFRDFHLQKVTQDYDFEDD